MHINGVFSRHPETQNRVFSLLSRADNARCARVCSTWKEPALNNVWAHLSNLKPLLRLLSAFKAIKNTNERESSSSRATPGRMVTFTRVPKEKHFKRFLSYAERVRKLEFNSIITGAMPSDARDYELDDYKFLLVMDHLNQLANAPFPNLHSLFLIDTPAPWMNQCRSFFGKNVKALRLCLHYGSSSVSFPVLGTRAQQLSKLVLTLDSAALRNPSVYNIGLPSFLSTLVNLVDLQVNRYTLSPKALESLAFLSHLRYIRTQQKEPWTNKHCTPGQEILRKGLCDLAFQAAFPSLEVYFCEGNIDELAFLFGSPGSFQKLQILDARFTCADSIADDRFTILMQIVSRNCSQLRKLYIRDAGNNSKKPTLSIDGLQSVAQLTFLEELTLGHFAAINIQDSQLADIFKQCKNLKELLLFDTRTSKSKTPLTLGVVAVLSEHCPQLQRLTLSVIDSIATTHSKAPVFRNLRELHLGYTKIVDPVSAVIFLSTVLPATCLIQGFELPILFFQESILQLLRTQRATLRDEATHDDQGDWSRNKGAAMVEQISTLKNEPEKAKEGESAARLEANRAHREAIGTTLVPPVIDLLSSEDSFLALGPNGAAATVMARANNSNEDFEMLPEDGLLMYPSKDESETAAMRVELESARKELATAIAEAEHARADATNARREAEKAQSEAWVLGRDLAATATAKLRDEIVLLKDEISALQVECAERRMLEAELDELKAELASSKEDASIAKAVADGVLIKGKKAHEEMEVLQNKLKTIFHSRRELESELEKLTSELTAVKADAARLIVEAEGARASEEYERAMVETARYALEKARNSVERANAARSRAERARNEAERDRNEAEAARDEAEKTSYIASR